MNKFENRKPMVFSISKYAADAKRYIYGVKSLQESIDRLAKYDGRPVEFYGDGYRIVDTDVRVSAVHCEPKSRYIKTEVPRASEC